MEAQAFSIAHIKAFTECLETSLYPDTAPDVPDGHQCYQDQFHLHSNSVLKGLLTKTWRQDYDRDATGTITEHNSKSLEIFIPRIRIIWTEQLKLWDYHLQDQFAPEQGVSASQRTRHAQYQHHVRLLYEKRDLCLPGHRDIYFPDNIEEYINQSSTTQLRQYLHNYEAAIHQSIQAAKQQPLRSLLTFPGFIRQTITRLPHTNPASHPPQNRHVPPAPGARGAPPHHRHTRWRNITSSVQSIRNFFLPKSKPD